MSHETVDCVFKQCESEKSMELVDTCYGFTGGDKWKCKVCGGYVVTRAGQIPVSASYG